METRYQWLKSKGICVSCGGRDAFPGYVHCPECIEKANNASRKCWEDKEKRIKYNAHGRERKKQLREERKEKHLCTKCGRPLPSQYDYVTSKQCRKRRNGRRLGSTTYGERFRERIEQGVCMYCGREVVPGYKLCEKHLEERRKVLKKTGVVASAKWRGEITRQWENAKSKSSVNGY